jgi:hypothetical protein
VKEGTPVIADASNSDDTHVPQASRTPVADALALVDQVQNGGPASAELPALRKLAEEVREDLLRRGPS